MNNNLIQKYNNPKTKKQPSILKKVPELSERFKKNREISVAKKMLVIFTLAIFSFSMICIQLTANSQRYELAMQIESVEKQLNAAKSEQVRLNAELNSMTSITKIDNFATNILGMTKLEKYQVEYINLSKGDNIIFSKPSLRNFVNIFYQKTN